MKKATPEEEELALKLFTFYSMGYGGKDYLGEAIPEWEVFSKDPHKAKQTAGWLEAARMILRERAELHHSMQTCLSFAARYAHSRRTGGAYVVITALKANWPRLSPVSRQQILRETHEASCNLDDWEHLRQFAAEYETKTNEKEHGTTERSYTP